ncbi:MAG: PEP-CTERM sorting domain-containing protein [Pseudomonadota bacterium]
MNFLKKAFIGAVAALALASSAQATNTNAGGVVWDPDYNAGTESDFISQFAFTQWFTTSATAIDTLTFGGAASIGSVLSTLGGAGSTGYYLQGAGLVNRINDASNNIAAGFGTAGSFCPGCQLTYAFGGIGLNKDSSFDLTNAWARLYVDTTTVAGTPVNSQASANNYVDGQVWLDLKFTDLQFLSGGVQFGYVGGNFDIIGGSAATSFNPGKLSYGGSTQFLSLADAYSKGGNGQALGNSVPEPGSMALVGLGLLAAGALRRRQASK